MLAYYTSPGIMTELPIEPRLLEGLPTDPDKLCQVSMGLIVHEYVAADYGVRDARERVEELENRTAADIVAAIDRLGPGQQLPLAQAREPERRMIGNCRHFSVLTTALLRRAGVAARARCGFAGYFGDTWYDHWIVERWDSGEGRWKRTDSQLDDFFLNMIGCDFDPLDLPEGRFLTGSEAWQICRKGEADPEHFGIEDMHGLWFIANNVVRDLAALNKVELLPWDTWGVMEGPLDDERIGLLDEIAVAVTGEAHEQCRVLHAQDGLRVPDTVRSARFQREVRI